MLNSIKLTNNSKERSIPKKRYNRDSTVSHRYGDISHKSHKNIHKVYKNHPFFSKLKEKYKIPSKTHYLDKKSRKSAYNLKQ